MCCTIFPVDRAVKPSNIGKPFPNTSFTILPPRSQDVLPIFGIGELCIGGPQLAREYHNNPELTVEKFFQLDGERSYRSGDKARMLADGTFEFIGRLDDQVKIMF